MSLRFMSMGGASSCSFSQTELEPQLDRLRNIQEAERVISSSFREVTMPKIQSGEADRQQNVNGEMD